MHACHGEEAVREELALDEGARRLGEIALVDSSSAVGETGLIFHNTLFDET
jgi:aminopeptidase